MPLVQLWVGFQSLPPLPISKLGPSGADSRVCRFMYVLGPCGPLQQTLLWDWEFLSLPPPPQVFPVRVSEALFPPHWNPGLRGLSHYPVVPPSLSAFECETTHSTSHHLTQSASHCLAVSPFPAAAVSAPLIGLDECFFFNSLVVRLPYGSIFCQFWLFLFLNLLFSFFWLCKEAQCIYLCLRFGWKSRPLFSAFKYIPVCILLTLRFHHCT